MKVTLDGLGDEGFNGDQEGHALAVNAFTNVENMRMDSGWAERVGGYAQAFDAAEVVPYWLGAYSSTTQKFLIHAGQTGVFADDGAARYTLTSTPLNGGITDRITGGSYNGVLVLNNGVDQPIYWGGNTAVPMATLTNWASTDRAKSLHTMGYYLVALNITRSGVNYPYRVMWSDKAEPGTLPSWTDLVSNDAGEVDRVGQGALVDALELGDTLILYFERSMEVMRFTGGNDVMTFQTLPDKYGMLAPGCGCIVPGIGHVVLTKGDVIAHAGQGAVSILDGYAKKWLLENIDNNYAAASFVVADPRNSEVWICFPENGSSVCTKALVWNWISRRFSKRDLPDGVSAATAVVDYSSRSWNDQTATWDTATGMWDGTSTTLSQNDTRLFMGSQGGKLFVMDEGELADGASFTGTLERTGLNSGLPGAESLTDRVKNFKRMWLSVDAVVGTVITVYFGASMDPDVAPTYSAAVTLTAGTERWVDSWATGVYLAYKITATNDFRIRKLVLEVTDGGMY